MGAGIIGCDAAAATPTGPVSVGASDTNKDKQMTFTQKFPLAPIEREVWAISGFITPRGRVVPSSSLQNNDMLASDGGNSFLNGARPTRTRISKVRQRQQQQQKHRSSGKVVGKTGGNRKSIITHLARLDDIDQRKSKEEEEGSMQADSPFSGEQILNGLK